MTTLILCPVLDCDWSLDATPPEIDPRALASVFGIGVMVATSAHQHANRVERDLDVHMRTHTTVQFLRTISRLTQERDEALAALEAVCS